MTATTCPDCEGLGYLGGEDTPSSCMNKWHKLARNESIGRVARVAKERQAFNEQAELKNREAIVNGVTKPTTEMADGVTSSSGRHTP
jgi:hypothetical protein